MKCLCMKKAWIRDKDAPAGQPAGGHFDCGCGAVVLCSKFGQAENVTCSKCGQVYDGRGWLKGKVAV